MKKQITTILITYLISLLIISIVPTITFAQSGGDPGGDSAESLNTKSSTSTEAPTTEKTNTKSTSSLIPKIENSSESKISYLTKLPKGNWKGIMGNIIKLILNITGSLTVISFTVGGVMMITAQGSEEKTSKGRSIITWSIIALLIIAISYAVVLGITQLSLI